MKGFDLTSSSSKQKGKSPSGRTSSSKGTPTTPHETSRSLKGKSSSSKGRNKCASTSKVNNESSSDGKAAKEPSRNRSRSKSSSKASKRLFSPSGLTSTPVTDRSEGKNLELYQDDDEAFYKFVKSTCHSRPDGVKSTEVSITGANIPDDDPDQFIPVIS